MLEKLRQTGGNSHRNVHPDQRVFTLEKPRQLLGIVALNAAVTEDQDIHAPTALPGSRSSQ